MGNRVVRGVVSVIITLGILVPMIAVPSGIAQAALPTISVGDRVAVTEYGDGVAVRSSYSTSSGLIRYMYAGYEGEVISGPVYNEGFRWWHIHWVTGHYGWTADAYPGGVIYLQPLPGNGIYPSVTNSGLSYRVCVYIDAGNLAVRTSPSAGATLITRKSVGSRGWTTADGPYVSTSEQMVWWYIEWDDGAEGWSADSRSDYEAGVYLFKEGSEPLPSCSVNTPSVPSGTTNGIVNTSYVYSTGGSSCAAGHSVQYRFDWGDGTFSSWSSSIIASKSWSSAGTYQVRAQARCSVNTGVVSSWSPILSVSISQTCSVNTPSVPSGTTNGIVNTSYVYSTGGSSCAAGHSVQYRFDWGDGTYSSWSSSTSASKSWSSAGTYQVKAQARCSVNTGVVSSWSSARTVSITAPCSVNTPSVPSGTTNGIVNTNYVYATGGSSCAAGHSVQYRFDWGDGTYSSWSSSTSASKSWSSADTYQVRAQARCSVNTGVVSSWSSVLSVTISTTSEPSVLKFLTLPFSDANINVQQGWHYTWDPYRDTHRGVDYIKGTIDSSVTWQPFDVVATADGWAMWSEQPGNTGVYGQFVLIRHDEKDDLGSDYFTLYAHLGNVAAGIPYQDRHNIDYDYNDTSRWTFVKRGQVIGRAGNTGATNTGIHLHFEVLRGGYYLGKTDAYDLYKTREFYPGGTNYAGCGLNYLWTTDPPSLPPALSDDAYWLAKAIMSEASIGTLDEQVAVGWTVLNRLDNRYGDSIEYIVKRWYAYNQEPTEDIQALATEILERKVSDPTNGGTHFFSPRGMPWEGDENSYIERLGRHFNEFDTGGGVHQVPLDGKDTKVYFPSWAKPETGTVIMEDSTKYLTAEPIPNKLEWRNLVGVRTWYFMFYRPHELQITTGIGSPGELRVYDSEGRVTGLVNGTPVVEILGSVYFEDTVVIFCPNDNYRYTVVGTLEGLYGLTVACVTGEGNINFVATDIPTSCNTTHQYEINWDSLAQDEGGVTVYVDSDGDGVFERSINSDSELTGDELIPQSLRCFIATAAYGTTMEEEVQILREFRDRYLLINPIGRALTDIYYRVSPPIAKFIAEHPSLKPIVRTALVPAVAVSTVVVNTSPTEKAAIASLLLLVSAVVVILVTRRRRTGMGSV